MLLPKLSWRRKIKLLLPDEQTPWPRYTTRISQQKRAISDQSGPKLRNGGGSPTFSTGFEVFITRTSDSAPRMKRLQPICFA